MTVDRGFGADRLGVHADAPFGDCGRETAMLVVRKWDLEQTEWAQRKLGLRPLTDVTPRLFEAVGIQPYETVEVPNNLITEVGWSDLFTGFFGTQATLFSATVGRIGIGSGTTAATAADTALGSVATNGGISGAGSNWKLNGASPTLNTASSPCTVVFTCTFGTTDAIGTWNEWAIDHGSSNSTAGTATTAASGHMINHAVPAGGGPGTKGAATWTATATLSFT